MVSFLPVLNIRLCLLLLALLISGPAVRAGSSSANNTVDTVAGYQSAGETFPQPESLDKLNNALKSQLQSGNLSHGSEVVEKITRKIRNSTHIDTGTVSNSYYLVGLYYLFSKKFGKAIQFLEQAARIKEKSKEYDEQYAKTIYNIGVAYNGIGDFISLDQYCKNSLIIEKKLYGESSALLIKTYSSLAIANIGLKEYGKSLEYSKTALNLALSNPGSADMKDLAALYNDMGVLYMRLADYSKAKVYLEKSEFLYQNNKIEINENFFNLLNSLAITYGNLGLPEKSNEYYRKGIDLALNYNSTLAYNFINSYAIVLGKRGSIKEGEALLRHALERARTESGEESPFYFSVLLYYSEYLSEFRIDNKKALQYFKKGIAYLNKNYHNLSLKDPLYLGYSSSLAENGDFYAALDVLQSLLFHAGNSGYEAGRSLAVYANPVIDSIKADRLSLKILRLKYMILWKTYSSTQDLKILETASATAKLIVEVLEKVRININEEDSRLILGDRYRDSYLNAIRDFNLLYHRTGNPVYLEDAFTFSEKSKVAGLLTATRELSASQFNIPPDLSELERKLKRDLNMRSAKIEEEMRSEHPETFLINTWKESFLKCSDMLDSLISVFEKNYPGYYSFKYNTRVISMDNISGLVGRNGNYVSYVASDTVLYIFVANRKIRQLLALPADSSLYSDIRQFRKLLGMPSPTGNAREAFNNFQETGYRLYRKIIEPIRPYLISKKLLISPDNILSYIPFETIPTSSYSGNRILYSQIPYLMNEFDISYAYSATFLAESMRKDSRFSNSLVAFAPSYTEPVEIKSALMNRQMGNGFLPDLPYARQEAEYVSSLTNGKLYENDDARETVFKKESGKYDIIHLAMHTVLNDRDPMYSTLIFSSEKDTADDRYLKTYEIYSVPLRAKMVVLSSCNTGAGLLYSGEGIMSLARGFIYSGSESVVMAMWEIEDKAGTDIVKGFYDNLKKGYSKSTSLRRARIKYLKNADQLRSHPYFWSALVVYGNNDPLYFSRYLFILYGLVPVVIALLLGIYFWRRRYS